ncbi:MAG: SufS family cysteine desulfurase [Bifidobacteriaceae bacterium]|nr:SufS family cysteine desulfurase [Bifidobacteriaceae bacterium]
MTSNKQAQNEQNGSVNWEEVRSQFPILKQNIHSHKLVYLDSAATSQKPQCVIDAESKFYSSINAGVHRGAHELAARSTIAFEDARKTVARFFGADSGEGNEEIVVTSGATGGLNLLAAAFQYASMNRGGEKSKIFALKPADEIAVTIAEHHSVLLPFQELAARTGAKLTWIEADKNGCISEESIENVICEKTKLVAFTHISNVTGVISPVEKIVKKAHSVGAFAILDACQSVAHIPVDLRELDADFAVFSAHKMYGPTGAGFLYGKRELLEALPPVNFGGSMVELAFIDKPAQYMLPPAKFEAGTQPVAQTVAAGEAVSWMKKVGAENIRTHEKTLVSRLLEIEDIPGVRILGPDGNSNAERIATVAFDVEGVHPHDVGQYLDAQGVAIRVGHHCAQPIHRHFGVYASNRVSCGAYTNIEDIDIFIKALKNVRKFFAAG